MKKFLNLLALIAIVSMTMLSTTSCSSDDDDNTKTTILADQISGTFSGTVRPLGYTDSPQRAYVTFTKLASDAVKLKINCSKFNMDLDEIIMNVSYSGDGGLVITPEDGVKNCNGTYKNGTLTLTFGWLDINWIFSGEKSK